MIAFHSIKPIKISISIPFTKPVIVAAIKAPNRETETKSTLDLE